MKKDTEKVLISVLIYCVLFTGLFISIYFALTSLEVSYSSGTYSVIGFANDGCKSFKYFNIKDEDRGLGDIEHGALVTLSRFYSLDLSKCEELSFVYSQYLLIVSVLRLSFWIIIICGISYYTIKSIHKLDEYEWILSFRKAKGK